MNLKYIFIAFLLVLAIFTTPAMATPVTDSNENETSDTEDVDALDDVIVTDEDDIADEVGMSKAEKIKIEYVKHGIGLKNFVMNNQLLLKLTEAGIISDVVISYVKDVMGEDSSELEAIDSEIEALIDEIGDGTNITREQFIDIHKRSKEFVKEFRNISHSIVTDGQDVSEIRKLIKEALIEHADELAYIKGKELRARKVHNILNHRVALEKLNRHVAALETAGIVDVDMKKRYNQFKNLERRYIEGNLTSDDIQKVKTVAKNKIQEIKTKREIIINNNKQLIKDIRDRGKEVVADIKDKRKEVAQSIRNKRAEAGNAPVDGAVAISDDGGA